MRQKRPGTGLYPEAVRQARRGECLSAKQDRIVGQIVPAGGKQSGGQGRFANAGFSRNQQRTAGHGETGGMQSHQIGIAAKRQQTDDPLDQRSQALTRRTGAEQMSTLQKMNGICSLDESEMASARFGLGYIEMGEDGTHDLFQR